MQQRFKQSFVRLTVAVMAASSGFGFAGCDNGPTPDDVDLRRGELGDEHRVTFGGEDAGDVLDDVEVLDGGMLDGGDDGGGGGGDGDVEFVWQPLRNGRNFQRATFSHAASKDVSRIMADASEPAYTQVFFSESNYRPLRLIVRPESGGVSSLGPDTAHEDLACLSARFACDGEAPTYVELFRAEGESCHPLIEKEPNTFFEDDWVRLADECEVTQILGEERVGNGFYIPFEVEFDTTSLHAYSTSWSLSSDDELFNPEYAAAAFENGDEVTRVRIVPSASKSTFFDGVWHAMRIGGVVGGLWDGQTRDGEHVVQADCGFGYEEVRALDAYGRYSDDSLELPEAYAEHEADMVPLENCDIRLGYRPW